VLLYAKVNKCQCIPYNAKNVLSFSVTVAVCSKHARIDLSLRHWTDNTKNTLPTQIPLQAEPERRSTKSFAILLSVSYACLFYRKFTKQLSTDFLPKLLWQINPIFRLQ